ncbi:MAG TPA: hypothetical protein VJA22_01835 [Patescibacteria group bacterium]|nr:hypothetical protein [Patescibacteria group bacterium]
MQSKKLTKNKPKVSTQQYLDIAQIQNDTVVLKDGALRAVILVSSINFNLKSEEEQNAIIAGYIQFLNSFDYPLQIVIQSRKLKIDAYVDKLWALEKAQTNELLRIQMADYRNFIRELVELGEIMTKKFFVVVPMSSLKQKEKGFFSSLSEVFTPTTLIQLSKKNFIKKKRQLDQRVEHIRGGLQSMGVSTLRLDTQALIELYYNVYNPAISHNQPLPNVDKLRVEQEFRPVK